MTDNSTTKKLAIVTGGSSGVGSAIVKKLTENDCTVVIADTVKPSSKEGHYINCDVANAEAVDRFFKEVNSTFGSPDILILNAGQGVQEKLTEGDPEKWQQVININLMGALRFIRAFVPKMLEKKQGNIVFISSVSANQPHPYGGIYSASKTALEIIAETLRLETLPHLNITVVSPGIVETNFFKNEISGFNTVEKMNMGAISPEEIAEDVWYALNKKNGTSINKIVTRPLKQEF